MFFKREIPTLDNYFLFRELVQRFIQKIDSNAWIWDRRQVLLLALRKFKRINLLQFLLKSPENLWFSDDFRGN